MRLEDNSSDALCADPPYGFRFMGESWDYDVPSVETWRECLRVLKPGAPLVAFGGSRTYHRLACAIEDAGFELRDCLMFLYGKGFPKSLNVGLALDKAAGAKREVVGTRTLTGNAAISTADKGGTFGVQVGSIPPKEVPVTAPATDLAKAWDGWGTALKPAFEPIILARKPLDGTVANNVARWGVGGLAIDACRVGNEMIMTSRSDGTMKSGNAVMSGGNTGRVSVGEVEGRWPANLILSHTEHCYQTGATREVKNGTAVKHRGVVAGTGASFGIAKPPGTPDAGYGTQQVEVWECADDCPVRLLDAQAGDRPPTPYPEHAATGAVLPLTKRAAGGYADGGGPSRFFYCAKVSTKEREAGCEGLPLRSAGEVTERADVDGDGERPAGLDNPRAGAGRTGGARNHHPTLKPIALTTWLARLILPPNPRAILVPFSGAGSEMIGALKAGWREVHGIEQSEEYVAISRARLAHWCPAGEEIA
jgi:site-specific DNA-methyltransferase (adenine-specific)